jgi:hypothetical protein
MRILFKYTSRSRPKEFLRGLNSIIDNVASDDYDVLVSLDLDDPKLDHYGNCDAVVGSSTGKIDAINRDLNEYHGDWDLLINMSDDMIFTANRFDNMIRDLFTKHFPNGDGFLHLNDGHQGDNVSTMSIMDRKYYERDRYIYHSEYKSLWCDAEATEVAWMRGRYAYESIVLFDHLHPAWGLAPNDAQYKASEAPEMWDHDKAVIERHRANNYGITNPVRTFKYPKI